MKVVLINTLYPPNIVGGAELSVQALAAGLANRGHEVLVVSLADRCERSVQTGVHVYYERLHPLGNVFLQEKASRFVKVVWYLLGERNLVSYRRLKRLLADEKPDVVHTNNLTGLSVEVWRAANELGVPIVHTVRDYYLMCLRNTMFRAGQACAHQCRGCRLGTMYRRRGSQRVRCVVGISNFIVARHLDAGYFPEANQRLTIHNGFDVRSAADAGAPLPEGGPLRVGYIGRLHPTKGIERLLAAVRGLDPATYNVCIAGRGQPHYERCLRQMADGLPVRFRGWVAPEAFYRDVDVVVVPSVWDEPMGRSIIEAFAHGLPVVVSNRGGMPEFVQDGKNGLIVNIDEPDLLGRVLKNLVVDQSQLTHLRSNAGALLDRFAVDLMVDNYESSYQSIAGTPAPTTRRPVEGTCTDAS